LKSILYLVAEKEQFEMLENSAKVQYKKQCQITFTSVNKLLGVFQLCARAAHNEPVALVNARGICFSILSDATSKQLFQGFPELIIALVSFYTVILRRLYQPRLYTFTVVAM
jgi:hypothetical protein